MLISGSFSERWEGLPYTNPFSDRREDESLFVGGLPLQGIEGQRWPFSE